MSDDNVRPFIPKGRAAVQDADTDLHQQLIKEVANRAVTHEAMISSGLPTLDGWLDGGFRPGSLVVVDRGNAELASGLAIHTLGVSAAQAGHRVRVLSPAQGSLFMYQQIIAGLAKIPLRDMQAGLHESAVPSMLAACEAMRQWDFRDVNNGNVSVLDDKRGVLIVDGLEALARANSMSVADTLRSLINDCADMRSVLIVTCNVSDDEASFWTADYIFRLEKPRPDSCYTMVVSMPSQGVQQHRFVNLWYAYRRFWEKVV